MNDILVQHKIIILIPYRNPGDYIVDCVNSILIQKYANYEVYLLDDASDDNSYEQIEEFTKNVSNFHYLKNEKRIGALANLHKWLIKLSAHKNDIIAIVDGDDQLFGEYSLQIVNYTYNHYNSLLTYGQFIDSYGNISGISSYTQEEFSKLRKSSWKATHLKTFKYSLFKNFLQKDPTCDSFRNNDGNFYLSTYDMALMFPLMEIAGYKKCAFIPNILYCYRLHPHNDHATTEGRMLQIEAEQHIRSRLSIIKKFSKDNK